MTGCTCWDGGTACGNLASPDSPDQMCDECEHGNHDAHEEAQR